MSLADVGEPIPLTWIVRSGVVFGFVIIAAVVLALAAHCHGSEPDAKSSAKSGTEAKSTAKQGSSAGAAHPVRQPTAAEGARAADREAQYKAAIRDLDPTKPCATRKAAIAKLVELRDPRARDPLVGLRRMNVDNSCVKPELDHAIKELSELK